MLFKSEVCRAKESCSVITVVTTDGTAVTVKVG